jgi:hypothetical protein
VSLAGIDPRDGASLREAVPEIIESVRSLLARVRAGDAARPPAGELASARVGWL